MSGPDSPWQPEAKLGSRNEDPMSRIDPNLALQATLPVDVPSLSDAVERIANDADLPPTRRRDMASALRSIAKALGRPPYAIHTS
jgi:hypothetical protein